MPPMSNPTGRHRPKTRHPGEGTVFRRKDAWRSEPWSAVVPFRESGRRRQMWLSAASKADADRLRAMAVVRGIPEPRRGVQGFVRGSRGWYRISDSVPAPVPGPPEPHFTFAVSARRCAILSHPARTYLPRWLPTVPGRFTIATWVPTPLPSPCPPGLPPRLGGQPTPPSSRLAPAPHTTCLTGE